MSIIRISSRIIAVALLCAYTIFAQESTPVFRSSSRLVLLDVVVEDKAGHAVHGLNKSDFTVLEDGVAQSILSFEGTGSQTIAVGESRSAARTVILLDQLNIQFQDLAYARDQIAKFLKEHTVEQQPTALMAIGRHGLTMVQDFTRENRILEERLAKLPALLANPVDGYADPVLAGEHAQEALRALAQLARAAVGYPFRLNVVWVTSGFAGTLQGLNSPGELSSGIRNVTNLLIRSRMSLYTIDPSGVIPISHVGQLNPSSGAKGRKAMQNGVSQFSGPPSAQQLTADQLLSEMTRLMGGVSYFNRNDVEQLLSQAIEDGSSAYALTYSPSNSDFQGKYRKIEVRINGQDVVARTRPGYYATPAESAPAPQTRDDLIAAALGSPIPYAAFNVACLLTFDGPARRLHGKISVRPQQGASGTDQNEEVVLAAGFDASGKVLSKWSWRVDWKTPWTNHPVSTLFDKVLPEGMRRVRFVVSDPSAERIGSCDIYVP